MSALGQERTFANVRFAPKADLGACFEPEQTPDPEQNNRGVRQHRLPQERHSYTFWSGGDAAFIVEYSRS
jgi:hypothetical protein